MEFKIRNYILLVTILLFFSCQPVIPPEIKWSDINNKTIETNQGFTGSSYTFLTDDKEAKLVVIQFFGSGVAVMTSYIYTCFIEGDFIIFSELKYASHPERNFELPFKIKLSKKDTIRISDFETVDQFDFPMLIKNTETAVFDVSTIIKGEYSKLSIW